MALPLPTAEQLFHPGGPMVRSLEGMNALQKHNLENQYYGPEKESEIGHRNALTKGQNIENEFMPEKLRLANAYQTMINSFYPADIQSQIAGRNALTNKYNTMTPLVARELAIKNQFGAQREAANIANTQAQSDYYKMGGGGMSTGAKEDLIYEHNVGLNNPQLKTPEQIREAADVYAKGGMQLSDGTRLNPMSEATGRSLDRSIKSTSTAKLITAGVQANQADSELNALVNHVRPVLKDLGTTYGNKSPQQIIDSFSNSKESQERLGRVIGARSLQYAIAQLRNRIDMGEPGINATKELMDNSGQFYSNWAPRLTPKAREEADKFIAEGVKKSLTARNKFGISARNASGQKGESNEESLDDKKATLRYNQQTGEFEEI